MIKHIALQNFRCFERYEVPLRERTIIVGRNNAGKSTIVEALRLITTVTSRHEALNFTPPPQWIELPARTRGVTPSTKGLNFESATAFHRYRDPPASIKAYFSTGSAVELYLGADNAAFAVIKGPGERPIESKSQAKQALIPETRILPPIGPLLKEERILRQDYVKHNLSTTLASIHFRNQLFSMPEFMDMFRELAESTWQGLRVRDLRVEGSGPDRALHLVIQDHDFATEVGWMGHGLQMWLQVMWFLARSQNASTVILDEPDVYMHPDLQRKIVRLVASRSQQLIIATHSTEILAEVDPEDVLVVDRASSKASFATSLPAVQRIVEHIGGAHNIHLSRLWAARKCLLVEGHDMQFLKPIHSKLFPQSETSLDAIPNLGIGGWSGWSHARGSSMLMKNAIGDNIVTYCIFDRDYHTDKQIQERMEEAKTAGVVLHIWGRKEIENYLLVPSLILRVIEQNARREKETLSVGMIRSALNDICDSLRNDIITGMADEYQRTHKSTAGPAATYANDRCDEFWSSLEQKVRIVPGKTAISKLSKWAQDNFGGSLNARSLIREIRVDEVDPELRATLAAIEFGQPFKPAL